MVVMSLAITITPSMRKINKPESVMEDGQEVIGHDLSGAVYGWCRFI